METSKSATTRTKQSHPLPALSPSNSSPHRKASLTSTSPSKPSHLSSLPTRSSLSTSKEIERPTEASSGFPMLTVSSDELKKISPRSELKSPLPTLVVDSPSGSGSGSPRANSSPRTHIRRTSSPSSDDLDERGKRRHSLGSPIMPMGHPSAGAGTCPVMGLSFSTGSCPVIPEMGEYSHSNSAKDRKKDKKASKIRPASVDDDDDSLSTLSAEGNQSLTKLLTEESDSDDGGEEAMAAYDNMDPPALRREIRLLKRINTFTRDIAENSNQAIVVVEASSKKIYWVNSRAQTMFGKLVDDLIENNVNILLPYDIARKHDKIMDGFLATWAKERAPPVSKVVNPREPREIKALRYNSDGTTTVFDAEIFVRYMKINGRDDKPPKFFMAYLNDISELKQMKHQLSVSRVIQQKSAEAIVVCDLFGKIITCNATAEQMFGTSLSFLLAHNKNIKWFMPRNIADKHDSYLSAWRDNMKAGYDLGRSTIIGKVRNMQGRRPGEKEDELFSIVLRVELVENELVAYIRDVSDTITKSEFNSALVGKVFPKCMKSKVLRAQVDAYEICEHLENRTILYTDLAEFTKYSNGTEVADVYKFVNAMYKAFDVIVPQFAGEVVKRTGDGIIAMFGLVGNVKRHADRAVYAALQMLHWASENNYKMRVGIASGDVGSGIFGDGESRPQWDVLGETVNVASRMQQYGIVGRIQMAESSFLSLSDPRLKGLFEQRVLENVKGYGTFQAYTTLTDDLLDILPLLTRRTVEIDSERKRILEREKRLEELTRGSNITSQGLDDPSL